MKNSILDEQPKENISLERPRRPHTMPHDFYIKNIAHVLRYKNDKRLAEFNITEPQMRLLGHIYGAKMSNQEISRKYLSEAMQIAGPSVTSLLNTLEKNGFIKRSSGVEDGRTMLIELTKKSDDLIKEVPRLFNEIQAELLQGFSEEEKVLYLNFLKRTYDNLGMESHI